MSALDDIPPDERTTLRAPPNSAEAEQSLLGGLLVSVFQAATQINEQMLSFLPRLLITLGMLMFAGHWILRKLSDLFIETFKIAGSLVG